MEKIERKVKRILMSRAYVLMENYGISGSELMRNSNKFELYKNSRAGLNKNSLNKIKKGLSVHETTKHKFIDAVNYTLKKKGFNDVVCTYEEIFEN
jgi:hypothetical protein